MGTTCRLATAATAAVQPVVFAHDPHWNIHGHAAAAIAAHVRQRGLLLR